MLKNLCRVAGPLIVRQFVLQRGRHHPRRGEIRRTFPEINIFPAVHLRRWLFADTVRSAGDRERHSLHSAFGRSAARPARPLDHVSVDRSSISASFPFVEYLRVSTLAKLSVPLLWRPDSTRSHPVPLPSRPPASTDFRAHPKKKFARRLVRLDCSYRDSMKLCR